jgi:hypothetical protein
MRVIGAAPYGSTMICLMIMHRKTVIALNHYEQIKLCVRGE